MKYGLLMILFLFIFLPSHIVLAGTFGVMPSEMILDVKPEEGPITMHYYLSRLNPKSDELINVAIEGDTLGAVTLENGTSITLPLGEGVVEYQFEVDPEKLLDIDSYKFIVAFTGTTPDSIGGQQLLYGAKSKVTLNIGGVVADQNNSAADVVQQENKTLAHALQMTLVILAIALIGVIFYKKGNKHKKHTYSTKTKKPIHIGLREVGFALISIAYVILFIFGYSIRDPYITSLDIAQRPQSGALLYDFLFYVTGSEKPSIFHFYENVYQELENDWNIFTTDSGSYFIPHNQATIDEYNNSMLFFGTTAINVLKLDKLPGSIDHVEDSFNALYVLLSGVRSDSDESFYCLSEFSGKTELSCQKFGPWSESTIDNAYFSTEYSNILFIEIDDKTFAYDIWRKTYELDNNEHDQIILAKNTELFSNEDALHSTSSVISLDGVQFETSGSSTYIQIAPKIYFERIEYKKIGRYEVNLIDLNNHLRTPIMTTSLSEQIYWLKRGTFFASPNIVDL